MDFHINIDVNIIYGTLLALFCWKVYVRRSKVRRSKSPVIIDVD